MFVLGENLMFEMEDVFVEKVLKEGFVVVLNGMYIVVLDMVLMEEFV